MAVYPQVYTKFIPPRLKNCIRRQRLLTLGGAVLRHRLTTVVAPAGYGKSVWVSSLLDEPGWPRSAWLSLDKRDTEPSSLLYHLIHAVKAAIPDFGTESLRTMNSLEDAGRDWLIAISSLIEELPRTEELVVILDDCHLIGHGDGVCGLLEYLVRWLPDNIHLVLIGRARPPLNLYRERCRGELLEIGQPELQFSARSCP
ncbi:MAG: hypothetical protein ABSC17_00825 [Thermacetogeniaceae bacterium]